MIMKQLALEKNCSGPRKYQVFNCGDVIYFTTPEYSNGNPNLNLAGHHISRVVGLPGERIEIRKGQVYIDEMKLESFYSYPTVRGMKKEEYLETVDPQNSAMTEEDFEESIESILVSEGSVFVLGNSGEKYRQPSLWSLIIKQGRRESNRICNGAIKKCLIP